LMAPSKPAASHRAWSCHGTAASALRRSLSVGRSVARSIGVRSLCPAFFATWDFLPASRASVTPFRRRSGRARRRRVGAR
jgi:hypothetical protein